MQAGEVVGIALCAAASGDILQLHTSPLAATHEEAKALAIRCAAEATKRHVGLQVNRNKRMLELYLTNIADPKERAQQTARLMDGSGGSATPEVLSFPIGPLHRAVCQLCAGTFFACVLTTRAATPAASRDILESLVKASVALKVSDVAFVHRSLALSLVCEELIHNVAFGVVDPSTASDWIDVMRRRNPLEPVGKLSDAMVSVDAGGMTGSPKKLSKKKAMREREAALTKATNALMQSQRPEQSLRESSFGISDDGIRDLVPKYTKIKVTAAPALSSSQAPIAAPVETAGTPPSDIKTAASAAATELLSLGKQASEHVDPAGSPLVSRVAPTVQGIMDFGDSATETATVAAVAARQSAQSAAAALTSSFTGLENLKNPSEERDETAAPSGNTDGSAVGVAPQEQAIPPPVTAAAPRQTAAASLDDLFGGPVAPSQPTQQPQHPPISAATTTEAPKGNANNAPMFDDLFSSKPVASAAASTASTAAPGAKALEVSAAATCHETVQLKANKNGDGAMVLDVVGEVSLKLEVAGDAVGGAKRSAAPSDPFGAPAPLPSTNDASADAFFASDNLGAGNAPQFFAVAGGDSDAIKARVTIEIALTGQVGEVRVNPKVEAAMQTLQENSLYALQLGVVQVDAGGAVPQNAVSATPLTSSGARGTGEMTCVPLMYTVDPTSLDPQRLPVQCRVEWSEPPSNDPGAPFFEQVKAMAVVNPAYALAENSLQLLLPRRPPVTDVLQRAEQSDPQSVPSLEAAFPAAKSLIAVQGVPDFANGANAADQTSCLCSASWQPTEAHTPDAPLRLLVAARFGHNASAEEVSPQLGSSRVVRAEFTVNGVNSNDGRTLGGIQAKVSAGVDGNAAVPVQKMVFTASAGRKYDFY